MKVPSCWKDLTDKQVKALCKFLLANLCPESLKISMLLFCAKITVVNAPEINSPDLIADKTLFALKSKKTGVFYASSADMKHLSDCFSFLFTSHNEKLYLQSGIVENHFPKLTTTWGRKLIGPASGLYNLTFKEYIRLETLFDYIHKKPSDELLYRFCGTIYRKRNHDADPDSPSFNGDLRSPFNDHLLKSYVQNGKSLSMWQIVYVRLFYEGCRNFIIDKFEQVFYSDGSSESSASSTFENLNKLVTGLCSGDLTKAEQIRNAPLYDAFSQLEALAIERKKVLDSTNKKPVY